MHSPLTHRTGGLEPEVVVPDVVTPLTQDEGQGDGGELVAGGGVVFAHRLEQADQAEAVEVFDLNAAVFVVLLFDDQLEQGDVLLHHALFFAALARAGLAVEQGFGAGALGLARRQLAGGQGCGLPGAIGEERKAQLAIARSVALGFGHHHAAACP